MGGEPPLRGGDRWSTRQGEEVNGYRPGKGVTQQTGHMGYRSQIPRERPWIFGIQTEPFLRVDRRSQ